MMQVCGGSQSFSLVNTLRPPGRWMRWFTIPNQSSVLMTYKEPDDAGLMRVRSKLFVVATLKIAFKANGRRKK